MSARQHFISRGIRQLEIDEFLKEELKGAGYGWTDIRKTPLGTRVTIHASKPGVVIGRRGSTVRDLTSTLEQRYGLENPQIEVKEITDESLNAQVVGLRLASALQKGIKFRRAVYGTMRRIKESDAIGAEISIAGKLTSQRARKQKFRFGTIIKTGQPSTTFVDRSVGQVVLKSGTLGLQVKIMRASKEFPDMIEVPEPLPQPEYVPPRLETDTQPTAEPAAESQDVQEPVQDVPLPEQPITSTEENLPEPSLEAPSEQPKEEQPNEAPPVPEEPAENDVSSEVKEEKEE